MSVSLTISLKLAGLGSLFDPIQASLDAKLALLNALFDSVQHRRFWMQGFGVLK